VEIIWFDTLASTQSTLIEGLKHKVFAAPVCIGTSLQSDGRGSRGNGWIGEEGNLFISVALRRSDLPNDLKLESTSIYLAFIMKELLASLGSNVWLKWPNDFYLGEKKIGGVITTLVGETLVCGIGINLVSAPDRFSVIDIVVDSQKLTGYYVSLLSELPSWKQIFSKYQLEFEYSRVFFTHHNYEKIALKDALLLEDGSLECDGQRIYSLR
jgi:BirA family biotin operon repressor/biotin-[acetyl-CoA-carboxylase] ligase